ncbi:hypothetical protein QUF75_16875 [Desulfococcaceae bacterium HSG7]|nr:hypothetical protein [Desulfococcaceae bacterium HSG7]
MPEIEERLGENGLKPEKMFGDAGFTDGETIIPSEEKEMELEGPTSGGSRSFEVYNSEIRPYDAGDYDISSDKEKEETHVN